MSHTCLLTLNSWIIALFIFNLPFIQRLSLMMLTNHSSKAKVTLRTSYSKAITKTCAQRTNIVFLKMHKCASSTVQNILFRFGLKHNLTFVMPPSGNFIGKSQNSTFHQDNIMKLPVDEYNIFCYHTRYNEQSKLYGDNVFQ